jgi:hypothetical protein
MEGLAEIITDFFNSIDPKRTSNEILARCQIGALDRL